MCERLVIASVMGAPRPDNVTKFCTGTQRCKTREGPPLPNLWVPITHGIAKFVRPHITSVAL